MNGAQSEVPSEVVEAARSARRVVVLTGAGMSAESGVPTFRDDCSGLWSRFDPAELATPQAWLRDRSLVWAWYLWRVGLVRRVTPNAGHLALSEWARLGHALVQVVTQNVDDLHERAGSAVLAHVHGSLLAFRCERCERPYPADAVETPTEPIERLEPPTCEACGSSIRPGVVWFGEMLPMDLFQRSREAVEAADLVLVVGTSGLVQPAASLPEPAAARGIPVVEINPVPTALSVWSSTTWRSTAAAALPALVAAIGLSSTANPAAKHRGHDFGGEKA